MSKLTTDTTRVYELGDVNAFGILANTLIYEGAAVGDNGTGYVRPLTGGDAFRGFADRHGDNTGGGDGDETIRVRKHGAIVLPIDGMTLTDVGKAVYALDDNTFTFAPHKGPFIGRVSRFDQSGKAIVDFNASLSIVPTMKPQ